MFKKANWWRPPNKTTCAITKLKRLRKEQREHRLREEDGTLTTAELESIFNLEMDSK